MGYPVLTPRMAVAATSATRATATHIAHCVGADERREEGEGEEEEGERGGDHPSVRQWPTTPQTAPVQSEEALGEPAQGSSTVGTIGGGVGEVSARISSSPSSEKALVRPPPPQSKHTQSNSPPQSVPGMWCLSLISRICCYGMSGTGISYDAAVQY
eukprot:3940372-Rhodomonas_salina.2